MKPIEFKEQTRILHKQPFMGDKKWKALPIHHNQALEVLVSCWKMSLKDRIKALIYGKIWLYVKGAVTQPPVSMICDKTGFDYPKEKK